MTTALNAQRTLTNLQDRLDRQAIHQLREEVARLAEVNEQLTEENTRLERAWMQAESWADSWREDALNMQLQICELTNSAPGITQSGQLVTVPQ